MQMLILFYWRLLKSALVLYKKNQSYQHLCGRLQACHQPKPPEHVLSRDFTEGNETEIIMYNNVYLVYDHVNESRWWRFPYTIPRTESFSLMEWRHFLHCATAEWTYTLKQINTWSTHLCSQSMHFHDTGSGHSDSDRITIESFRLIFELESKFY